MTSQAEPKTCSRVLERGGQGVGRVHRRCLPSRPPAVSGALDHAAMPTLLSLDDHLGALVRSGAALGEAAAAAGQDAKVPTGPARDVTQLLIHQGMVHRWAAATIRGLPAHPSGRDLGSPGLMA